MDTATIEKIRHHLGIILGHEAGCLPEAIGYLDECKDQAEGHLAHYLKNRSYEKAWIFLQGDKPESGICGR